MPRVISCNGRIETVMDYKDVANLIVENLGIEVLEALKEFEEKELVETPMDRMVKYVEDGIFTEQIEESCLIEEIIQMVIADLESQGFFKKSKNLNDFRYEELYYKEKIDEKLSPGMMAYFE